MKAILAVSVEGMVANSDRDDMTWTGSDDKAIFRMLTSVGGVLGCSHRTRLLMPPSLKGRTLLTLSRNPQKVDHVLPQMRDLAWFKRTFQNPWLIGGQAIVAEAVKHNMLGQAFICKSMHSCHPTPSAIPYTLGRLLVDDWRLTHTIRLSYVAVEVWDHVV